MWIKSLAAALVVAVAGNSLAAPIVAHAQSPGGEAKRRAPVRAVPAAGSVRERWRARLNEGALTIISGNPNGGFLYTAYDLSVVVDDGDNMRLLPVVGKGGAQNVRDILFLRSIDMGIIHPYIVKYFEENGELGRNVAGQLAYIMPLFADEFHLVVRNEITRVEDLAGKKVNFSDVGSGTQIAMRLMFKRLKLDVVEVNMGQTDAYEAMKRGEIFASGCTCAKPLRSVATIKSDWGLKLLNVPYRPEFEDLFLPSSLSSQDYPNAIAPGQKIETFAVQTVLATYNWPANGERYRRVAKFVDTLFTRFDRLHKPPRNPKWRAINFSATVPGLQRFAPAQAWIDIHLPRAAAVDPRLARQQAARAAPSDPAEQERLFQKFLEWIRQNADQ